MPTGLNQAKSSNAIYSSTIQSALFIDLPRNSSHIKIVNLFHFQTGNSKSLSNKEMGKSVGRGNEPKGTAREPNTSTVQ